MNRVVVVGGGPGGYEAALVAAQLGADVTVVDTDGARRLRGAHRLRAQQDADRHRRADGRHGGGQRARHPLRGLPWSTDLGTGQRAGDAAGAGAVRRHRAPAHPRGRPGAARPAAGSTARSAWSPPRSTAGPRRRSRPTRCCSPPAPRPRTLDSAQPDGERILTWEQVYELDEVPEPPDRGRLRASPVPSSPAPTTRSASTSRWSPAATGCCPARTPTPPRCSRRSSPGAA